MSNQIPPFSVRLPRELREWLDLKAEENGRSLNNELIHRLKESKNKEEKRKKQD